MDDVLIRMLMSGGELEKAQVHAALLLSEHTARLADAQETANLIAAFQVENMLSISERNALLGRIGAALVDGRHG